jgi:hypothetical protein
MTTYLITMEVDKKWFQALDNFTADIYDGEICKWVKVEEIN